MKSILIVLLAIFCQFNNDLFSQTARAFGIKAGIELPNVSVTNSNSGYKIDPSNNIGIIAGVYIDMLSCNKLTLSSELDYEQTNVNTVIAVLNNSGNTDYTVTGDYKIKYLTYYLKGKYNFGGKVFSPYIFAGPKLNVYMGDKFTNSSIAIIFEEDYRLSSDNFKKLIFGIDLGAGIEIRSGKKFSILAEFDFSPALSGFYEESNVSAKSNSLSFKTGTKFYF